MKVAYQPYRVVPITICLAGRELEPRLADPNTRALSTLPHCILTAHFLEERKLPSIQILPDGRHLSLFLASSARVQAEPWSAPPLRQIVGQVGVAVPMP